MQIVERVNKRVRSLTLDLDKEALDRLFAIEKEMLQRGVEIKKRQSGPKIEHFEVVPAWYTTTFLIDEAFANELLTKLKEGAANG